MTKIVKLIYLNEINGNLVKNEAMNFITGDIRSGEENREITVCAHLKRSRSVLRR